jgi:hypothetical protein
MTPEEEEEACKTDVMVQHIAMRYAKRCDSFDSSFVCRSCQF